MQIPRPIKRFVEIFSELPGIGPRAAMRLAFHFIYKGENLSTETMRALDELRKIKICKKCYYISEGSNNLCEICSDKKRMANVIAIVEKETDLISIENSGRYHGRYLILGDLRKKGVLETDQRLKIQNLIKDIKSMDGGMAEEIILAINPTSIGILNSKAIAEELKPLAKKITRLGIGIPSGGEIEFADEETLGEAISRRG